MKLIDILEGDSGWSFDGRIDPNTLDDDEQIKWMRGEGEYEHAESWLNSINQIEHPSIKVQLAAIHDGGTQITSINNPSDVAIQTAIDLDIVGNIMYTMVKGGKIRLSPDVIRYGLTQTNNKQKHI